MAAHIGGQRGVQPEHAAYSLEFAVVVSQGCLVLAVGFCRIGGFDDREYVGGIGRDCRVSVYNAAQARFYPDAHLLSGLFPDISQDIARDIAFMQEHYVDKGHAPCAVAEYEQVPGQGQCFRATQVHGYEPEHNILVHGSFPRVLNAGVCVLERIFLDYEPFLDSLVVDRAQYAHVE